MNPTKLSHEEIKRFGTRYQNDKWAEYFSAFGHFMQEYACIETTLRFFFENLLEETIYPSKYHQEDFDPSKSIDYIKNQRKFALEKIRKAAIKSLLGSMQLSALLQAIERLININSMESQQAAAMKRISNQIIEIQKFRNRLVHNGARLEDGDGEPWFLSDDKNFQKLEEDSSIIHFRVINILDATRDMRAIEHLLFNILYPEQLRTRDTHPLTGSPMMQEYYAYLEGPFYFNSNELRQSGPKFSKKRSTPRPAESSRKKGQNSVKK